MSATTPAGISAPLGISGLWVPIITPLRSDGDLDEISLWRLANRLLADGVDGLVALGTTGEPATLDPAERRRVVEICADACGAAGRGLVVGAGTNSTLTTIDEISHLTHGRDVAAALVVVPYYTRPSQEAVVEHFTMVADHSQVPVLMYNVPYRTGRGLDSGALLSAGEHPNIVGLKQAVGSLDTDTVELLRQAPSDVSVLAGDDAFIAPTVLLGGSGAIAAAAHLCTPLFVEMVAAARAGHVRRAVQLAEALLPVVSAGFAEPSPAVWKGALVECGDIDTNQLRRPMTTASLDATGAVIDAVAAAQTMAGISD